MSTSVAVKPDSVPPSKVSSKQNSLHVSCQLVTPLHAVDAYFASLPTPFADHLPLLKGPIGLDFVAIQFSRNFHPFQLTEHWQHQSSHGSHSLSVSGSASHSRNSKRNSKATAQRKILPFISKNILKQRRSSPKQSTVAPATTPQTQTQTPSQTQQTSSQPPSQSQTQSQSNNITSTATNVPSSGFFQQFARVATSTIFGTSQDHAVPPPIVTATTGTTVDTAVDSIGTSVSASSTIAEPPSPRVSPVEASAATTSVSSTMDIDDGDAGVESESKSDAVQPSSSPRAVLSDTPSESSAVVTANDEASPTGSDDDNTTLPSFVPPPILPSDTQTQTVASVSVLPQSGTQSGPQSEAPLSSTADNSGSKPSVKLSKKSGPPSDASAFANTRVDVKRTITSAKQRGEFRHPKILPQQLLDELFRQVCELYENGTYFFVRQPQYYGDQKFLYFRYVSSERKWYWSEVNPFEISQSSAGGVSIGMWAAVDNIAAVMSNRNLSRIDQAMIRSLQSECNSTLAISKARNHSSKKNRLWTRDIDSVPLKLFRTTAGGLQQKMTFQLSPKHTLKELYNRVKKELQWNKSWSHVWTLQFIYNGTELTDLSMTIGDAQLCNNCTLVTYLIQRSEAAITPNLDIHLPWNTFAMPLLTNVATTKMMLTPNILQNEQFRELFFSTAISDNKVQQLMEITGVKRIESVDALIRTDLRLDRAVNLLMDQKQNPFYQMSMLSSRRSAPTLQQLSRVLSRPHQLNIPPLLHIIRSQETPSHIQERINKKYNLNPVQSTTVQSKASQKSAPQSKPIATNDTNASKPDHSHTEEETRIAKEIVGDRTDVGVLDYVLRCLVKYRGDKETLGDLQSVLTVQIESADEPKDWTNEEVPDL